jgi:4-alpha-glucanotransferase
MTEPQLHEVARSFGLQTSYGGIDGRRVEASDESLRSVLRAIGADGAERAPVAPPGSWPPVLVVRPGAPRPFPGTTGGARVLLEDGGEVPLPPMLPGVLPYGYHRIVGPEGATDLVVAPDRCYLPPSLAGGGRAWGFSLQLYALRSASSWGMGDLADLRRLGERPEAPDFLLLNPLHAPRPGRPQEPSPYSPSSRLYRNPLYIAVGDVPELAALDAPERAAIERLAAAGRALTNAPTIDRDAIYDAKDAALKRCFAAIDRCPGRRAALAAFRARDERLDLFATFCTIAEDRPGSWRDWPPELQRPDAPAIAAIAAANPERVAYHGWLQMVLEEQLATASRGSIGIICDLAVGVDAGGFDAWAFQDITAASMSVGCPPDGLGPAGQDWGLPPFVPDGLRQRGYRDFAAIVRANMAHAGGLRIDHAMAFFRLFWIPAGRPAAEGVYVGYPADDLLGIVALESQRAECLVVGEALGTVAPGVLEALEERDVLAYRLVVFEETRPADYPRRAMAAVTTHDLPTLAGLFADTNLPHLRAIGALDEQQEPMIRAAEDGMRESLRRRSIEEGTLDGDARDVAATIRGAYGLLARTPSMLRCVAIDDALGATERPNVPGTIDQHPNWRVPLPATVETVGDVPLYNEVVAIMREEG